MTGEASTETMLGEVHVRLVGGQTYDIRPWGIRTSNRIMGRFKTLVRVMTAAYGGNLDLETLLTESYEEIVRMVADTIHVPFEELYTDDYLLEDLLQLVEAIIKVNFTERPGGGSLGKALTSVMGAFESLMPTVEEGEEAATTEEGTQEPSSS